MKMSLQELTKDELIEIYKKEGLSCTHDHIIRSDLVDRLEKHYEQSFTSAPDKDFSCLCRRMKPGERHGKQNQLRIFSRDHNGMSEDRSREV